MRLLMIGRLNGELITASKICMQRGASVTQADAVPQGLNVLRARGADLIMIDVGLPIRELVTALEAERIRTPVVACGVSADASTGAGGGHGTCLGRASTSQRPCPFRRLEVHRELCPQRTVAPASSRVEPSSFRPAVASHMAAAMTATVASGAGPPGTGRAWT